MKEIKEIFFSLKDWRAYAQNKPVSGYFWVFESIYVS